MAATAAAMAAATAEEDSSLKPSPKVNGENEKSEMRLRFLKWFFFLVERTVVPVRLTWPEPDMSPRSC